MTTINAYPLAWPIGWKRTPASARRSGKFRGKSAYVTVHEGCTRVLLELERLAVDRQEVVISTNTRLRLDGLPRSGDPEPDDTGVAVYWRDAFRDTPRVMAVDHYERTGDNLAAVAATLEAMRAIERHGGAVILERAFTGFLALPAPAADELPWWQVLGLERRATAEEVRLAHRKLSGLHHPDRGGDTKRLAEINVARDRALEELR